MSRLTIISIVLAVVVSLNIGSLFYLKNVTEKAEESLKTAVTEADMEKILSNWDKNKKKIGLFIHEDAVNEITDSLESCYANCNTDFFKTETEKAVLSLQELYQKQLPTFYNIF